MKKLLVLILFSISACKHQPPVEKVRPIVMRYFDSIGKHYSISNARQLKQIGKYSFSCEFRIIEDRSGFPSYATGYFKFDTCLIKVKKFYFDTN
jgi:hypothetical protein